MPQVNFCDITENNFIELLGSRNSSIDQTRLKECREDLKRGALISFLPTDIEETWLPETNGQLSSYGARNYKIAMYGIIPSGEMITTIVHGVFPMFEIRVPKDKDPHEFEQQILNMIKEKEDQADYKPANKRLVDNKIVFGMGIEKYKDHANFIQLYFRSTKVRKDYIGYFRDLGYKTTHDDKSCYYRVLFRNIQIALTKWMQFDRYTFVEKDKHPYFKGCVINVNYNDIMQYTGDIFTDKELLKDRTIHALFDIETYDPKDEKDEVPMPHNASAVMPNIGLCFTYRDCAKFPVNDKLSPNMAGYDYTLPKDYIRAFNITLFPTHDMPDRTTILCRDHNEMIRAFAMLFKMYRPNLVSTFNGDEYDWKWIIELARKNGLIKFLENHMSIRIISKYRELEKREIKNINQSFSRPDDKASYEYWTKYSFKINAELTVFGQYLKYPGYTNVDARPQLRKMKPDARSSSLRAYLKSYKLGDKVEMPYQEMFETFRKFLDLQTKIGIHSRLDDYLQSAKTLDLSNQLEQLMTEMVDIAEYCIVDAVRCQDLLLASNIVNDRREVASLCYISFNDAIYYADGMKVRNASISKAKKRGLHVSNITSDTVSDEKYPGAYVFLPKKGRVKPKPHIAQLKKHSAIWCALGSDMFVKIMDLIAKYGPCIDAYPEAELVGMPECFIDWLKIKIKRPIAGLDFSSLYPSIIMTYNLSPEMLVYDPMEALKLKQQGKDLYRIEFQYGTRKIGAWSVRSSLPSRQKDFDEWREKIKNSTDLNETQKILKNFEDILIKCEFGFFGTILVLLFDERDKVKKLQKEVEERIEHMQLLNNDEFNKVKDEFEILMQKFKYYKSKQLALKVLMNTFYGETGNQLSSIYFVELAGGITSAGQYNIKMVAEKVESMGCVPYYGDTDSVYISMPDRYFTEIDHNYYSTPIDKYSDDTTMSYYRKLVETSFVAIQDVRNEVNQMLINDNKNIFLKMAYEEILFPTEFYSKKKYGGIAHVSGFVAEPSLEKKSLFVRGLDYIKSDASELLKDICETSLFASLQYLELRTISEILEARLIDIYENRNVPLNYFIRSAMYKPKKKNITVNTFVDRMRVLDMAPMPYERFDYIVVEKYPYKYDLHGRKIPLKIAEFWEYANVVKEKNLQVKFDYYMENTISKKIARLMIGDNRFNADDEDTMFELAHKYVIDLFKRFGTRVESKGPALQAMYRKVNKSFQTRFNDIIKTNFMSIEGDDTYNNLIAKIDSVAKKEALASAIKFAKRLDGKYQKIYEQIMRQRQTKETEDLYNKLRNTCTKLQSIIEKRDNILGGVIDKLSNEVNIENSMDYKYIAEVIKNYETGLIDVDIVKALYENINQDDVKAVVDVDVIYCRLLSIKKSTLFAYYVSEELKNRYKPIVVKVDESDLDNFLNSN